MILFNNNNQGKFIELIPSEKWVVLRHFRFDLHGIENIPWNNNKGEFKLVKLIMHKQLLISLEHVW